MSGVIDTNKQLLRLLGLGGMKNVISLDIACRPQELPRVTITTHAGLPGYDGRTQQFQLLALKELPRPQRRPLNLDHLCDAARSRIAYHIHAAGLEAFRALDEASTERARHYTGFTRELIEERQIPF